MSEKESLEPAALDCLAGGEMGARKRAFIRARAPAGPAAGWPLPKLNGYDAYRRIRAHGVGKEPTTLMKLLAGTSDAAMNESGPERAGVGA